MTKAEYTRERQVAERLAHEAGALLLRYRAAGLQVQYKTSPDDPVTVADQEASQLILSGLNAAFPDDGLLSEEEADSGARLERERVWIVDPIDGTKEYTTGSPDFCVSIGLAQSGQPVLGVVYAPLTDELFSGALDNGVFKNGQAVSFSQRDQFLVSVSDTEFQRELHRIDLPGMQPSGSIALKLARVAAGEADVTFSMSPRSEWDIAAGHALLRAVGGVLRRRDGRDIIYNAARPHLEQGLVGGCPEALEWLEGELRRTGVPTAHLGLIDTDPAWGVLSPIDQVRLAGHSGVHIRYAGRELLALLVVEPRTRTVERAEGTAFHLKRLSRDVTRALGSLSGL